MKVDYKMFVRKLLCLIILVYSFTISNQTTATAYSDHIESLSDDFLTVHFIDVGQGDSILIKTPEDQNILIDGGPPNAGENVMTYLKKHNVQAVDLLIATHPHYDHIGGLVNVIEEMPVKRIVHTGIVHPTKTFFTYMYQIFKQAIPINIPAKNEQLLNERHLSLEVLNGKAEESSINNASLVLKLTYHDVDFLLMSDLEKDAEKNFEHTSVLQADIIKVAHHGSKTSSSLDFLKRVAPDVAILTYGRDNKYGHPNERVLENIRTLDAFIYSTATFGDIVISTNGADFYVMPTSNPLERALQID